MPATNVSESQIILSNAIATSYLQLRPAHKMEIPERERWRRIEKDLQSASALQPFSIYTIASRWPTPNPSSVIFSAGCLPPQQFEGLSI